MVRGEAAERFLSAPWLGEIAPEAKRALLDALVEERPKAGSVLLAQGQPNDHLSFLIHGSAVIERKRPKGPTEALAVLAAPSVLGTTSFFTPDPPTFTVKAGEGAWLLTLHHPAHDKLRADSPAAAEAIAVATVRVLSERFNELDRTFSDYMDAHPHDHSKYTEWAGFRARLFEEPGD